MLLQATDLHAGYGRVPVLQGVSLHVDDGEFVGVIGANGAGKTTFLRAVSQLIPIFRGEIRFDGQSLSNWPAHKVPRLRIAHVPEGRQIFPLLTVADNLRIGGVSNPDRESRARQLDFVLTLFPRLAERLNQKGGTLSGGEQQMLSIGRALMLNPRLLMLDEPSQGLARMVVAELYQTLRKVNELGVTILLVEQNVAAALKYSTRCYVLEHGLVALEGESRLLQSDDRIRQGYLGI